MFHRGRPRRISPIELIVLRKLKEKPLYGNELINELKDEFKGTIFHAKSGTIYPILKKLQIRELIEEEAGDTEDQYKKRYKLTEKGERKLSHVIDDDMMDEFMGFFHKFSDIFSTDFPGKFKHGPMKNVHFLKTEISRLEKRKKMLESDLLRINEIIENKKKKLQELEKDVEYYDIPIE